MRAVRLVRSQQTASLVEERVAKPEPATGELLIEVYAAGVTPTELEWYPSSHTKDGGRRERAIPAHEFSGVIAAVGQGVEGVELGQAVYGLNDWHADGALAEYCLTQPASVAPKPRHLTHIESAAVPIGALTAWQGLFDRADLRPRERVLIHGGAGAVGVFAVQLARFREAHVVATASAANIDFVRQLGADEVIDYRATRFEDHAKGVDVVFDAVGGDTAERSWGLLNPGGRLVTIAADVEGTSNERLKRAFFIVEPNRDQLVKIGDLIDAGRIRPVVDTVFAFADAAAAYQRANGKRPHRGKMVVAVASQQRVVQA
jgi:NADPH:quinone reductase-like Zn-dependent oxidoreductase